jgi:hypothetical protein
LATVPAVDQPKPIWHTRGSWNPRDDRRAFAVWLALLWIGVLAGFGLDMPRFLHQVPPPPLIVHVHAVVFTGWMVLLTAQILLVLGDRVAVHRRLGWLTAVWAGLMTVLGPWASMAAKGPVPSGPASPQFLSIQLGAMAAFVVFVVWGISLRRNPAAHKRIMILATVALISAGYARVTQWFFPEPHSMLVWFGWNYYGDVLILALVAGWDLWRGRLMKQFAGGAVCLLALECLNVFLYQWGPWKVFTTGLIAAWARHFG